MEDARWYLVLGSVSLFLFRSLSLSLTRCDGKREDAATADGDSDDQFLWYLLSKKSKEKGMRKEAGQRKRKVGCSQMHTTKRGTESTERKGVRRQVLDTKCVIYANTCTYSPVAATGGGRKYLASDVDADVDGDADGERKWEKGRREKTA